MRLLTLYWIICILLSAGACQPESKTAQTDNSRQATARALPSLITIGGTITEIVNALGFGEQIVATDRTSTYPPEMQQIPSLGYRNSIAAEGVLAQKADFILAEAAYMEEAVYTQLASAGVHIQTFTQPVTLEETKALIRQLAEALKVPEKAQPLLNTIDQDMHRAKTLLASHPDKPSVLFVYARGQATLQIGGGDTFARELVRLAGGTLAVPEISGYKPLTTEALVQANPDYLLFFDSGLESLGGIDGALQIPGVAQTNAGRKRQIIAMDGLYLSGFGPRVGAAVHELAAMIHPSQTISGR